MTGTIKGLDFRVSLKTKAMLATNMVDRLTALQNKLGLANRSELLTRLVDIAEASFDKAAVSGSHELSFDSKPLDDYDHLSEQQLVDKATQRMSFNDLISRGTVSLAKRIFREMQDDSPQARTRQNINKVIEAQMADNLNANGDKTLMRFVNASVVCHGGYDCQLGEYKSSSNIFNYNIVKEILMQRQDELDAHHKALNLTASHNLLEGKRLAHVRYNAQSKKVVSEKTATAEDKDEGCFYEG